MTEGAPGFLETKAVAQTQLATSSRCGGEATLRQISLELRDHTLPPAMRPVERKTIISNI
jgi:hypothetical protein